MLKDYNGNWFELWQEKINGKHFANFQSKIKIDNKVKKFERHFENRKQLMDYGINEDILYIFYKTIKF